MNRLFGLVTTGLLALSLVWGCSSDPPRTPGGDDDGGDGGSSPGSGGSGATGGSGVGGAGGSGGSAPSCTAPRTQCGAVCSDLTSDSANCGSCGRVCSGATPFCSASNCVASCAPGTTACGMSCVNLMGNDNANCGACGSVCTGGKTCNAGACVCPAPLELCAITNSCVAVGTCGQGVGGAAGSSSVGGASGAGGTGTSGTGGTGMSGAGGTGAGGTGNTTKPPGYWEYGDWHGCSWTGVGKDGASTIMPMDFVAKPAADAYCVSGTVGAEPEYKSVALLGFNTGEPPPADCAYEPVDVNAPGPPGVTKMAGGIAVNFVKRGANTSFTLRVQLQGPNGHKEGAAGEADRWCATITEVQGKVFVPYSSFTPKCWEMTEAMRGTPYVDQPISAVVFLVPGAPTATPFDFCVNGFAYGTTAADAPDGPVQVGDQMGTVGGEGSDDLDFDREKIVVDGEQYIIQNNNWGSPGNSNCILSYVNNSFNVTACTGTGASAPAAFPSIYQGNNGNTANGVYSTKTTDSMPIQISNIASINSTFRYSGSAGGEWNACYDIWFANSPPTTEYQDGINGFVMIWLRDPPNKVPIGNNTGSVMIAGQSWNKWVGIRGPGPAGNNNSPVVSFTNPAGDNDNSRSQSFVNKNILEFINAASSDIPASLYLTDIFGGFEIWSGGAGAKVDEFKVQVVSK